MKAVMELMKFPLKYSVILIAIILLIGLTLSIINIFALPGVNHDETYTIIRSVGQGPAYHNMVEHNRPPVMLETRNAEWLAFLKIDDNSNIFNDVTNISRHLAGNTNPPLVNVLLYLWISIFGSTLYIIKLFNVFIYAISVLIFYLIAKELFENKSLLLVLLVYAISYVHLTVTVEVRSYALFGLWNLLTFYSVIKIIKSQFSNKALWWLLFAIVSILGFYTHYVFCLVFLPVIIFLIIKVLKDKNRKQQAQLWGVLAIIVVCLIPHAINFLSHTDATMSIVQSDGWYGERSALSALNWEYFASLFGMFGFGGRLFSLPFILRMLIAAIITLSCIYGILRAKPIQIRNLLLLLFLSNSIIYLILYKVEVFPIFTVGPKYQIAFFPYFLLSIILLFKSFKRNSLFLGCMVMLISFIVVGNIISYIKVRSRMDNVISASTVRKQIPKVDLVILDSVIEGLVGPVITSFPEDQNILIGSQKELADTTKVAEVVSRKKSVVYINALKYHHKDERRDKIIRQIKEGLGIKESSANSLVSMRMGCKGCGKGYKLFIF